MAFGRFRSLYSLEKTPKALTGFLKQSGWPDFIETGATFGTILRVKVTMKEKSVFAGVLHFWSYNRYESGS